MYIWLVNLVKLKILKYGFLYTICYKIYIMNVCKILLNNNIITILPTLKWVLRSVYNVHQY